MSSYGLIGRTLKHSFSKQYFGNKFFTEGIDADYSLFELGTVEELHELIATHKALAGLNVTIPYKVAVMPLLDELSDEAQGVGAVNCIKIRGGKLMGYNTDVEGIVASLRELDIDSSYRALVLGTGGASRAVQYVLRREGIEFMVVSREEGRGDLTYAQLTHEIMAANRLIINTTPLGMYPDVESAAELRFDAITEHHRLFDLVYNPSPTRLMTLCAERGARTLGGGLMLRVQAEASWRIWQGE